MDNCPVVQLRADHLQPNIRTVILMPISSLDDKHLPSEVWEEIKYPVSNFNHVPMRIQNNISHSMMDVIDYSCRVKSYVM